MTSGKSTIGPIVANVHGWEFVDLDRAIENREQKSVVEIFEQNGEEYFRNLEHELLAEFSKSENLVIALGGGTMAHKRNLDILKNSGTIVYLRSSPEMIYKRLRNKIDRPIFRDLVLSGNSKPKDFIDRIKKLMNEREPFYSQADIYINTDETPIGITVDKLVNLLKRGGNEKN